MQRKWQREWDRRKGDQLATQSTNSGLSPLKTLARTILPPVAAATMLLATMTMPAYANPTGGQVTSGAGSISQSGNTMNITQTTNKLSINWQSFNIAANETVNFQQLGASSIALNRVVGNNASSIYGHLNANGKVFLINTNGILFAPGSSVNVGGIVASTLNLSDSDFQKGKYNFNGNGGSVVNQGTITATNGGYVALLGGQVSNQGVIVANQGTVALGAGKAATLDFNGDGLYSMAVNEAALNAEADNQNLIQANGGQVVMTARAANALAGSVLNNTGVIEAQSIGSTNGIITLDGGTTGAVVNSGTLDASGKNAGQTGGTVKVLGDTITLNAGTKIDVSGDSGGGTALIGGNSYGQGPEQNATTTTVANGATVSADAITSGNGGKVVVWSDNTTTFDGTISAQGGAVSGNGGSVETSGKTLTVGDNALVTTLAAQGTNGNWLLDPDGFTIGVGGDMTGTTLTNNLANGNVTIASTSGSGKDGNINVNDTVTWSANTLTLTATNNIYVNNVMTATGSAGLVANYGKGTNTDGTPMGLYTSQSATDTSSFAGRIDFSGTGGVTMNGTSYTVITDLAGLVAAKDDPAGHYVLGSNITGLTDSTWTGAIGDSTAFTGSFNGFGHRVSATLTGTGLFGTIGSGAVVSNLGVSATVNPDASSAKTAVGILANVNKGSIVNSFSGGTMCAANLTVPTGSVQYLGGLVGDNSGLIAQSYYCSGDIYATNVAGGLVGINETGGRILDSSVFGWSISSAQLTRDDATWTYTYPDTLTYVGGLVGVNEGTIERSYSKQGLYMKDTNSMAGSFAGKNTGTIDQCYATGSNSGTNSKFAGFVWENTGTITNAYTTALGNTSNSPLWTAGFVYKNSGTISSAYTTEYSANSTTGSLYGFVGDNTGGTIKNAYWYASTKTGATTPTDTTAGVTQFTDTTAADGTITSTAADKAATFSSYTGFDTNIWGASTSGYPILRNMLVYASTWGWQIPTYGSATDVGTLGLAMRGLQGGGGNSNLADNTANIYDPVTTTFSNLFTVTTDNGYVDAGTQSAASVLSSSLYKNIKGTVTVAPKALTIAGVVAEKTYDGTTSATLNTNVTNNGLVGLVGNQTLNISYTGAVFADDNAGTDKTATITYANLANGTNGGKASNYTIANTTTDTTTGATTTTTTATITPLSITATFTGQDKVYDGTTNAGVSSSSLSGVISGDSVSVNYNPVAAFADKNAGTGKTVTVSGVSLSGTDSGNYTVGTSTTTTASITPLPLQLIGTKSSDDGNVTVTSTNIVATNLIGEDTVTLGGSVKIAGTTAGVQAITDVSALTANNPNYTVVGSVGKVVVGNASLVLDHVVGGDSTATIATSGKTTTITQTTDKAVIDWLRFSIAANETVTFVQPSTTSIVLNRVTGSEQSVIAGALTGNGRVFLINANGVLFTAGSSVNVGALVASTLNLSDSNFINNNYVFTAAAGSGSVIAEGDIVIVDGGFLALVSNGGVTNSGSVNAPGGDVLLVSADKLTLTPNTADSGLSSYVIAGLDGATTVGGVVNVAATSGNGGLLETAGNTVTQTGDFQLATGNNGTWSWSLPSISIGSGGTFTSAFVKNNLLLRNLSLNALGGDLTVNDAVTWSSDATLSLSAKNNININNAITATGANAGLVMNYGGDYNILTSASYSGAVLDANGLPVAQEDTSGGVYGSITLSGANASLKINGNNYTLIHSMSQLDSLDKADAVTGMYYNPKTGAYDTPVSSTITASVSNYKYYYSGGKYYNPATGAYDLPNQDNTGAYYNPQTMKYELTSAYSGNPISYYYNPANSLYNIPSYTTSSGAYYDPSTQTYHLTSAYGGSKYYYNSATGNYDKTDYDTSSGKYYDPATGGYTSNTYVSATAFYFNPTTGYYDITSPYSITGYYALASNLDASGTTYTSALINTLSGTFTGLGHTISNLTINAPSVSYVGLIGQTSSTMSTLRDLGLTNANITGKTYVGPLLAYSGGPVTVKNAYSTGAVQAASSAGGLIGAISNNTSAPATVSDTYSSADVTVSNSGAGGLIGSTGYATVTNSHASGNVTSVKGRVGGLIGNTSGYITGKFLRDAMDLCYATGNVTVTGTDNYSTAGGLVGGVGQYLDITNSFATGDVSGRAQVGGLVGLFEGGSVKNTYATGDVTSNGYTTNGYQGAATGGLIGVASGVDISDSFATGDVTNTLDSSNAHGIGGLVGVYGGGTITDVYATGNVTGTASSSSVGGLIGSFSYGTLTNGVAYGNVSGGNAVGGLAGNAYDSRYPYAANINNSIAYGNVSGVNYVGGVVGYGGNMGGSDWQSNITNSISYGNVTGTNYVGGVAGYGYSITGSASYGAVTGADYVGSVAGDADSITNSDGYGTYSGTGKHVGRVAGNVTTSVANSTYTDVAAEQAAKQEAVQQVALEQAGRQDGINNQDSESAGKDLPSPEEWLNPVAPYQSLVDDRNVVGDSSLYSPHVKSIEANGVEYQLDNDSNDKDNDANGKEK